MTAFVFISGTAIPILSTIFWLVLPTLWKRLQEYQASVLNISPKAGIGTKLSTSGLTILKGTPMSFHMPRLFPEAISPSDCLGTKVYFQMVAIPLTPAEAQAPKGERL